MDIKEKLIRIDEKSGFIKDLALVTLRHQMERLELIHENLAFEKETSGLDIEVRSVIYELTLACNNIANYEVRRSITKYLREGGSK